MHIQTSAGIIGHRFFRHTHSQESDELLDTHLHYLILSTTWHQSTIRHNIRYDARGEPIPEFNVGFVLPSPQLLRRVTVSDDDDITTWSQQHYSTNRSSLRHYCWEILCCVVCVTPWAYTIVSSFHLGLFKRTQLLTKKIAWKRILFGFD